jgi:galactokinase
VIELADLRDQVRAAFRDPAAIRAHAAPGRVNLIGDHTDYNDGFCLPMAIDRWCVVGAGPPGSLRALPDGSRSDDDPVVRAASAQYEGTVTLPTGATVDATRVEPAWARFVAGVIGALAHRGSIVPGADLMVASTVPGGSGLSSSSALAVALTMALADRSEVPRTPVETARLALDAEVRATGVPGGLMDQLAALLGRADRALLIDCRSLVVTPVPIGDEIAVLVVHSGLPRTLAGSEYAARRAECEAIAARLGLAALRDATPDQVAEDPRARHVVTENARVLAAADALGAGELARLGRLMLESHASLRDDYGVSTRELDVLVDSLVAAGAAGARLTGAGFGGCVVAVARHSEAAAVLDRGMRRYRDDTALEPTGFVARAVDGAMR